MRVAAAAWPISWHDDWASFEGKVTDWVEKADADLMVFPEYGLMDLVSLAGKPLDLETSAEFVSDATPEANRIIAEIARQKNVFILGPSGPLRTPRGYVNRATFFGPSGVVGHQDKQIMTRYEREQWLIVPGGPLTLFETPVGRIGVLICYDAEFPLLGRSLVEAGAEVLLCPSATEALSGYSRVRIGAQARALEGQCISLHAPLVGQAPWCEAVDASKGCAGVFCPPDVGFPDTGVLALGSMDDMGWTQSEVDLTAIAQVRANGRVLNVQNWPEQRRMSYQHVNLVRA
ncbi:MAG: carbon-nitrogen hydrolase family protein [Pseudomonadota bacterium]